jgi:hypothetical protein
MHNEMKEMQIDFAEIIALVVSIKKMIYGLKIT